MGTFNFRRLQNFAQNQLGLTEHNHSTYAGEIVEEARKANIQFVPTVIVGSHIFDESISADELTQLINE